jgi:hypothetical protein
MRTSSRLVPAVAFFLAALPVAARADDPAAAAHKVVLRDRWKAGEVATLSGDEKRVKSIVRFVGSEASKNPDDSFKENRVVDQEVVVKCVEANDEGVATKRILYFAKFSYATKGEAGPENDTSLEKVFVAVDGVGAARTLTILSPDAKPSPRAMRWLEAAHGKGETLEALCGALEPKEPLAVEATWKPTGEAIAAALGTDEAPIDAEKSSAEVTLTSVDGAQADSHLVVSPASKGRLVGKTLVPWKTGGTGRLEIRTSRGLAGDAFDTTGESEESFEGAVPEKGGETRVSIQASAEWVWAKGGTMPPIPPPGAAKPDAPAPDAPKPDAPAPDAPKPEAPKPAK